MDYHLLRGQVRICITVNSVIGILNNKLAGQALYLSHVRQDKDHSAVLPC